MTTRGQRERPTCKMWERGRCTLSSFQCQFRHAIDGPQPPPRLGSPFVPLPQSEWSRWRDRHDGQTPRRALEEIQGVPLSQMSRSRSGVGIQSNWIGGNNLHYTVEDDCRFMPGNLYEADTFNNFAGKSGIVANRIPLHPLSQVEHFDIWDEGQEEIEVQRLPPAAGAEFHEIEICEDEDDGHLGQYRYGSAITEPCEGTIASRQENRRSEVGRPPLGIPTPRSSSLFHRRIFPSSSTIEWPYDMSQTREHAQNGAASRNEGNGPHPSFIQVANPYIFEQKLQNCLTALGASEHKEDSIRLQGVHWIDSVRKALQLPIRTFNTAVVYYHKFRLVHADNEYMFLDAAAAALFTACKIEDTLKKSREVLCAAYNLKVPLSDHLSPDDQLFEASSKTVVGLERLMLESAGFDFRNRHPQEIVLKLVRDSNLPKNTLGRIAYNMSVDIYRTFAPLKQSAQTMAIACVELAARLLNLVNGFDMDSIVGPHGIDLNKWSTTRAEIMETLLDLLDLFTHHRNATIAGGQFSIDNFISVRIALNKEATSLELPRHAEWIDTPKSATNGTANGSSKPTPVSPAVGSNPSPNSPPPMGPTAANGAKSRVGERGKDGTVRFMLSADRARAEKDVVAKYFAPDEYEEYEEEVEVPIK